MRFLSRCALLSALFALLFFLFVLLAIQRKGNKTILRNSSSGESLLQRNTEEEFGRSSFSSSLKKEETGNKNNGDILVSSETKKERHANEPTDEDKEARRLLQLAGGGTDDGVPVPVGQQFVGGSGGASFPQQLETAIGAGLLFPIGRYPSAGGGRNRGGGGSLPTAFSGQLTLNVAVVLVVSLLSIAVLIAAICCVIVIALAMESANSLDRYGRHGSTTSTDFLLSSWPQLMLPEVSADARIGNNNNEDSPTLLLTDDEMEDERREEEEEEVKLRHQMGDDLEFGGRKGGGKEEVERVFAHQAFEERNWRMKSEGSSSSKSRNDYKNTTNVSLSLLKNDLELGRGQSWPATEWRQFEPVERIDEQQQQQQEERVSEKMSRKNARISIL